MAEAASQVTAKQVSSSGEPVPPWVGRSIPRVEDSALLTGRGRFIDDLGAVSYTHLTLPTIYSV